MPMYLIVLFWITVPTNGFIRWLIIQIFFFCILASVFLKTSHPWGNLTSFLLVDFWVPSKIELSLYGQIRQEISIKNSKHKINLWVRWKLTAIFVNFPYHFSISQWCRPKKLRTHGVTWKILSNNIYHSIELVYTDTDTVSVRLPYWHNVSTAHTQTSYFRSTTTLRDTQNHPFL